MTTTDTWPGRTMRETLPIPPTRLVDVAQLLGVGDTIIVHGSCRLPHVVLKLYEYQSWCGSRVQAAVRIGDNKDGPSYLHLWVINGHLVAGAFPWGDRQYDAVTIVKRVRRAPVQMQMFEGIAA